MRDKVYIIAEAGVNHNGSFELAIQLCDMAKNTGVDAIKFQTFNTEINVMKDCGMAEYQISNVGKSISHWDMIKGLELTHMEFEKIKAYCDRINIEFLSTPSEKESLHFLLTLGMDKIKISSGEITNVPFLRSIGRLKKQVILSTGMSDLGEIEDALDVLTKAGTKREDVTILHCNSEYPTPMEDVNLRAMCTIKESLKVNVGYSDHTLGIEVPIAAVALGATIIEKHFTLSKTMEGPDHKASLEPNELKAMVKAIRNIEKALGNGIKKASVSEIKNINICRKGIVAAKNIKKGEVFSEDNLTVKRPMVGVSAVEWDIAIGKSACRDFMKDETIEL